MPSGPVPAANGDPVTFLSAPVLTLTEKAVTLFEPRLMT